MFERYTLSTTSFPSQTFDETGCDYFLFHMPGKKDHITVNIHYSLEHHNGIHTEEVDLLKLKASNDLPSWYPLLQFPYQIDVKVTCTGFHVYVDIIYITRHQTPTSLHLTFTLIQVTSQYDACTVSPVKKIIYAIIEVEIDKSLQFQVNWLNIERDTSVKARPKIHHKILNFCIPFVTLTLT